MGRWEPNAKGRLQEAAFTLFGERGYDATTVAEIAKRAGLTERTFFRHFADKRELLFDGSAAFEDHILQALANAPADLSPIDAVGVALAAGAALLSERREGATLRRKIIASNPELQERERIKFASLAAALARALVQRGARESAAALAAETGIAVFRIAYERWLDDPRALDFTRLIHDVLDELKTVTAGRHAPGRANDSR